MEVAAACAGGICLCGCNRRRGDGRCWRPRRWDLVHRGAAITRRGRSCAVGIWLQESSENELVSSMRRWDLAWRRRQGWRRRRRAPVGFASADATSAEVTGVLEAARQWDFVHRGGRSCTGGIWLQESSENELGSSVRQWDFAWRTSADAASAEVTGGFGPQRRSDNEARSFVRRWDLAPGKQRE